MAAKKVGLALGAGSAFGLAHIGVLQVLEENGIPIDFIAGCSMGAVIGGVYSCGTDLYMTAKLIDALDERDYMDLVLPFGGGFVRGVRFRELVKILTKNYDFSQTKIPFKCVACDISNGELVIMENGKLHDAIRGSFAIPGIFEPHEWHERLLVDGSVLMRVPFEVVKDMGADIIIGVDVGYRGGPVEIKKERIYDFVFSSFDLMQWQLVKEQEKICDVLITPKVRALDPNSFRDIFEYVELGRHAALSSLPKLKKAIGL